MNKKVFRNRSLQVEHKLFVMESIHEQKENIQNNIMVVFYTNFIFDSIFTISCNIRIRCVYLDFAGVCTHNLWMGCFFGSFCIDSPCYVFYSDFTDLLHISSHIFYQILDKIIGKFLFSSLLDSSLISRTNEKKLNMKIIKLGDYFSHELLRNLLMIL